MDLICVTTSFVMTSIANYNESHNTVYFDKYGTYFLKYKVIILTVKSNVYKKLVI